MIIPSIFTMEKDNWRIYYCMEETRIHHADLLCEWNLDVLSYYTTRTYTHSSLSFIPLFHIFHSPFIAIPFHVMSSHPTASEIRSCEIY